MAQCIHPIQLGKNKVPCGKCNFCLQSKRADWSFRLANELKRAKTAVFLTITYDEANVPYVDAEDGPVQSLCMRDIQLFTKSLRQANAAKVDWPLRYYTVGEYGTQTFRPHYHSIMFNLHFEVLKDVGKFWKKGHIQAGTVTPASIHYVTKYVINRTLMEYDVREPP